MTLLQDQIALIKEWTLVRNLSDAIVTSWVRMFEERLNDEMRVQEMLKTVPVEYFPTLNFLPDCLEIESIHLQGGRSFEVSSTADFRDTTRGEYRGRPVYAIIGNTIHLNYGAQQLPSTTLELTYYARVTPLDNAYFPLFNNFPSLYTFGPLTFSAPYLQEDERLTVWGAFVNTRIQAANTAWQTRKLSGGKLHRQRRGFG